MGRSPLLLSAAALLAGGCDLLGATWSSQVSFTLDRDRVVAGQIVVVSFDKLADEDGKRYWVAIQREEAPSTEQEGKTPVGQGVRSMRLTARQPCACEVRVYTESSGGPNMIIARRKLRVTE